MPGQREALSRLRGSEAEIRLLRSARASLGYSNTGRDVDGGMMYGVPSPEQVEGRLRHVKEANQTPPRLPP